MKRVADMTVEEIAAELEVIREQEASEGCVLGCLALLGCTLLVAFVWWVLQ